MQRDWDLIREILLQIEQHDRLWNFKDDDGGNSSDLEDQRLMRHFALLDEVGFVDGLNIQREITGEINVYCMHTPELTWSGHDFLESIRDDTVWEQTKEHAKKAGGSLTLSALTAIATHYLMQKLGMGGN